MEYFKPIILTLLIHITITVAPIPEIVDLVVGQPFYYAFQIDSKVLDVQDASGEELPTWLIWKRNER